MSYMEYGVRIHSNIERQSPTALCFSIGIPLPELILINYLWEK